MGLEEKHTLRMLRTAEKYFEQHPQLERIHVGDISSRRGLVIDLGGLYAGRMGGRSSNKICIVDGKS
jgi:hypothetical protein